MTAKPAKRPMKEPGLIGSAGTGARHHVPPNVSGRDVSAAVRRMPSFDDDDHTEVAAPAPLAPSAPTTPEHPSRAPLPSPNAASADATGASPTAGRLFKVRVELLDDSPYQPRRKYDQDALEALGESLRHHQEEAIVVKPKANGRWELVSGHRRKRGALLAQLPELEARLFTRDEDEAATSALVTNEAREDLSDYERALAYQERIAAGKNGGAIKTQDQLAQRLGKSKSLVSRRLALLKLPSHVLEVLDEFPRAVTINSMAELMRVLEKPHDKDKLVASLRRVGAGEINMAALASILAAAQATAEQAAGTTSRSFQVQAGGRLAGQVTPHPTKPQVMVKLADGIDRNELARRIADLITSMASE